MGDGMGLSVADVRATYSGSDSDALLAETASKLTSPSTQPGSVSVLPGGSSRSAGRKTRKTQASPSKRGMGPSYGSQPPSARQGSPMKAASHQAPSAGTPQHPNSPPPRHLPSDLGAAVNPTALQAAPKARWQSPAEMVSGMVGFSQFMEPPSLSPFLPPFWVLSIYALPPSLPRPCLCSLFETFFM